MTRTVLTFGVIAGVINSVLMLSATPLYMNEGKMDFQMGEIMGYLSMIIALSMIFFGIRSYRDRNLAGKISFGRAFQVGLLITLVASAIYLAGWMIYSNLGNGQDFMDQYFEYSVEQLRESGQPREIVQQEIEEMREFKEWYRNPLVQIGVTFMEIFPVGLVISLISAGLLRRS